MELKIVTMDHDTYELINQNKRSFFIGLKSATYKLDNIIRIIDIDTGKEIIAKIMSIFNGTEDGLIVKPDYVLVSIQIIARLRSVVYPVKLITNHNNEALVLDE